jgi:hypothetical protein
VIEPVEISDTREASRIAQELASLGLSEFQTATENPIEESDVLGIGLSSISGHPALSGAILFLDGRKPDGMRGQVFRSSVGGFHAVVYAAGRNLRGQSLLREFSRVEVSRTAFHEIIHLIRLWRGKHGPARGQQVKSLKDHARLPEEVDVLVHQVVRSLLSLFGDPPWNRSEIMSAAASIRGWNRIGERRRRGVVRRLSRKGLIAGNRFASLSSDQILQAVRAIPGGIRSLRPIDGKSPGTSRKLVLSMDALGLPGVDLVVDLYSEIPGSQEDGMSPSGRMRATVLARVADPSVGPGAQSAARWLSSPEGLKRASVAISQAAGISGSTSRAQPDIRIVAREIMSVAGRKLGSPPWEGTALKAEVLASPWWPKLDAESRTGLARLLSPAVVKPVRASARLGRILAAMGPLGKD